ncbi:MAG: DUF4214 domain-containing protein, partial [Aquihabitans sp.]
LRAGAKVNDIGASIYGSSEFYNMAGGNAEGFVRALYQRILGRNADAGGLAYWKPKVVSNRGAVAADFFASLESRTDRVRSLYGQILWRYPDPAGQAHWVDQLRTVNDVRLAVLLASSSEYYNNAKECDLINGRFERAGKAQHNGNSFSPVISGDGRHVAYSSAASNIVPGDTNGQIDVFVWDRYRGITSRITNGNAMSRQASISRNGRFVAFQSFATNLVGGDTNGQPDIFRWDRDTGQTIRITNGNGASGIPSISGDGHAVAFLSEASNLVTGDTNNKMDVFRWTMADGIVGITHNAGTGNTKANGDSDWPTISADGSTIAFVSKATNLVANDTNGHSDLFVHRGGSIKAVTKGNMATDERPSLSADGQVVVFASPASNLVANDTNNSFDIFRHHLQQGTVSVTYGAGNGDSKAPSVSASGNEIAFESTASNHVPGDTNGKQDVFRWRHDTPGYERVSVSQTDQQSNDMSLEPSISDDGRLVAFESYASNLVPGDNNGTGDIFIRHYFPLM